MISEPSSGAMAQRYERLITDREPFLTKARTAVALTLPFLLNEEGQAKGAVKQTPYQSLGSLGLVTLSSKLLLALFPTNEPFFRFKYHATEERRGEAEIVLSRTEKIIMDFIEESGHRTALSIALKLLLATGNSLIYFNPENLKLKTYRLDRYVCKRDPMGTLLTFITREDISPTLLPESLRQLLEDKGKPLMEYSPQTVALYTEARLVDDVWHVEQEVCGEKVPDSSKRYPKDKLPYICLRYSSLDGEDYGRGLVEELIGDLKSAETLSRAIVQGAAAAAKIIFLVRPNGMTQIRNLQDAANGQFISGQEGDVTTVHLDKQADFGIAQQSLQKIEKRIAASFLMNSSVQRQGERVTAEEIRLLANELESALGGAYSLLSQELQRPYILLMQSYLARKEKIPSLPDDIKPVITTGTSALGRTSDLNKLQAFVQMLQPFGEAALKTLDMPDFINRLTAALSMEPLTKDEETLREEKEAEQQRQQQQVMQEAMVRAAPQAVSGAMKQQQMGT